MSPVSLIKALFEALGLDSRSAIGLALAVTFLLSFFGQLPIVRRWLRTIRKRLRVPLDWIKRARIRCKWTEDDPVKELAKQKDVIERYFDAELAHCEGFCEFGFNLKKDYVENSKEVIESQSKRNYLVRPRRILGHKPLKHRDVIELLEDSPMRPDAPKKPFAIIGDAACGKTVEMMKLFAVLAHDWVAGKRMPILIFVNSLDEETRRVLCNPPPADSPVDLKEIVCSYLRALLPPPEAFITLLKCYWDALSPILLFDAVDECPVRQQADNMLDALAAAGRQPSPATIVVSCREKEYAGGGQFVQIKILELTPEQVAEHFLRQQAKWPKQIRQMLTKEEIEREMAASHPMANYLSNAYFLILYLKARAARPSPCPAPSSLSTLFKEMFLRDVNKAPGIARMIEHGLPYFEDVLSRVADCMTESVLKGGSPESGAVSIDSIEFLHALLEHLPIGDESAWRRTLREHLSTASVATDRGSETSSRLTGLLSSGSDVPFAAFTSHLVTHPCWTGGSAGRLACSTISWARKFGFPLPLGRSERKALRCSLIEVMTRRPVGERAYAAGILALSFRAVGWAIDGGILRYNQPAGKLLRFWHQRIREYLTAHHIERRGFEAFLSGASMDSAWWAETINMLAAVTASPRKMLLATLDSLKPALVDAIGLPGIHGDSDPWRVLVAAESIIYIPMERHTECMGIVNEAHRRLKELALEPIVAGKPELFTFKIWAMEALGKMLAKGVMAGDGTLVRGVVAGLREPALEKAALDALVTLLRVTRLRLSDWMAGLIGVLYGLLGRDPEPIVRTTICPTSLGTRAVLWLCCHSGLAIRGGAWLIFLFGCTGCLLLPLMGRVSLSTWWFLPTIAVLGMLLWDRAYASRSMADTIYRWVLRLPVLGLIRCFKAIVMGIRWSIQCAVEVIVALGKAVLTVGKAFAYTIWKLPEWTGRATLGGLRWFTKNLPVWHRKFRHSLFEPPPAKPNPPVRQVVIERMKVLPPARPKPLWPPKPEQPKPNFWKRFIKALRAARQEMAEMLGNMGAFLAAGWPRLLRAMIIVFVVGTLLVWMAGRAPNWVEDWQYRSMRVKATQVREEARSGRDSRLAGEAERLDREVQTRLDSEPLESIAALDRIAPGAKVDALEAGITAWSSETERFRRDAWTRLHDVQNYIDRKQNDSSADQARMLELQHLLQDAEAEVQRLVATVGEAERTSARLKYLNDEFGELRRLMQARDQIESKIRQPAGRTLELFAKLAKLRSEVETRNSHWPFAASQFPPLQKAFESLRASLANLEKLAPPPPSLPPPPPPVSVAVNPLPEAFIYFARLTRELRQQAEEMLRKYESILTLRRTAGVDEGRAWQSVVEWSGWLERIGVSGHVVGGLPGQLSILEGRLSGFSDSRLTGPIPAEELKKVKDDLEAARVTVGSLAAKRSDVEKWLGEGVPLSLKYLDKRMAEAAEIIQGAKAEWSRLEGVQALTSQTLGRVVLLQDKVAQDKADQVDWWRRNGKLLRVEFSDLKTSTQSLRKEAVALKKWAGANRLREALDNLEALEKDLAAIAKVPESVRGAAMSENSLNSRQEAIKVLLGGAPNIEGEAVAKLTRIESDLGEIEAKFKPINSEFWKGGWKLFWAAVLDAVPIALSALLPGILIVFACRRISVARVLHKLSETPAKNQRDKALEMLIEATLEFVRQAIVQYVERLTLKTPEDEVKIHCVREELERRGRVRYRQTIGSLARIAADIRKRILHGG